MAGIVDKDKLLATVKQNAMNATTQAVANAGSNTSGSTTGNTAGAQTGQSAYTGLAGLSEGTQQHLGALNSGYTPSQSVTAAQQYLNNVVSGKPGNYQSQYQGQLESLYNQVMNRDPFRFNLNGDALYNQYRDQYTQLGQQAMMDTMGQAAALTGGYGNSYAQTAGQQAYQNYLTQLNNIAPELYQMAWDRYNQEGDALRDKLTLTQGLEDSAYGRYRDTVSDWNTERSYASDEYWNQYNTDYSNYANMLNYWNTLAGQENAQYNANRELAYNQAMAILQAGKTPSDELLAAAGISAADAKLLADANKKSSGSSSKKSSSGGNVSPVPQSSGSTELGATARTLLSAYRNLLKSGAAGPDTAGTVEEKLEAVERNGTITVAEADTIRRNLGLKKD
jgi:hypothetical protein